MIDLEQFIENFSHSNLSDHLEELCEISRHILEKSHGDMPDWLACINNLPVLEINSKNLAADTVSVTGDCSQTDREKIIHELQILKPWRKGPFQLFDVFIDTEWRSDWKWRRVLPHLKPLKNKTILDVGCGSGYHCYRMAGEGADFVLGIDPSLKFIAQFQALQKYFQTTNVQLLPLKSEQLPENMQCFDTVFSMGVLYHRRSPMDHLDELKNALKSGGELVLETLVVEGDRHTVLMPDDRYAQMRNVWFLPSTDMLAVWLQRCGFKNITLADVTTTSTNEQRATEWMSFHSLENFLDPDDPSKTVEGYPAPMRATLVAEKP